jgi:hypothetical protein
MKRFLLLLGAAALLVAAPVSAQYISLDTNLDGVCDLNDVLTSSVTSIDVYFDTNHNKNGTTVPCSDGLGTPEVNMTSYMFILRTTGSGSVRWDSFTNNMSGMGFLTPLVTLPTLPLTGPDFWAGYGGTTAAPASGNPYKVATIGVTVTGNPVVNFAVSTTGDPNALMLFGSECLTLPNYDASWKWMTDFTDACGTAPLTPVTPTTWGQIKNMYR